MNMSEERRSTLKRVSQYLGQQKKQLKQKSNKFNERMSIFSNLNGFIDLEKQLEKMNVLNNPLIQQQIQLLKDQKETRKEFEDHKKLMEEQKQQVKQIENELQLDLDEIIDDRFSALDEDKRLNLINQNYNKKQQQIDQQLFNTNKILNKVKQMNINRKNISDQIESISTLPILNKAHSSQSSQFYNSIYDQIQSIQEKKQQKEQFLDQKSKNLNEKYQVLENYLNELGIKVNQEEEIPHEGYYKRYSQRSEELLQSTFKFKQRSMKINASKFQGSPSNQSQVQGSPSIQFQGSPSNSNSSTLQNSPKKQKQYSPSNHNDNYSSQRKLKLKQKNRPQQTQSLHEQAQKQMNDFMDQLTFTEALVSLDRNKSDELLNDMEKQVNNNLIKRYQQKQQTSLRIEQKELQSLKSNFTTLSRHLTKKTATLQPQKQLRLQKILKYKI